MDKTYKIFLIVILVAIVGFAAWGLFTENNSSVLSLNESQTSSVGQNNLPSSAPATEVVKFVPATPATSTPSQQGSCWTNSIAAPFRADAWRCTVGNSISDPCFDIPGSKNLLCNVNPTVPDSTSTFVLKLTQPLPQSQPVQGLPPSNWAWLVQLADGTLCTPFTGTLPFTATGETGNYGCAPGPLGSDILIFGDLNTSSSAWIATVGTLAESTSGLPTVSSSQNISVSKVWQ